MNYEQDNASIFSENSETLFALTEYISCSGHIGRTFPPPSPVWRCNILARRRKKKRVRKKNNMILAYFHIQSNKKRRENTKSPFYLNLSKNKTDFFVFLFNFFHFSFYSWIYIRMVQQASEVRIFFLRVFDLAFHNLSDKSWEEERRESRKWEKRIK